MYKFEYLRKTIETFWKFARICKISMSRPRCFLDKRAISAIVEVLLEQNRDVKTLENTERTLRISVKH